MTPGSQPNSHLFKLLHMRLKEQCHKINVDSYSTEKGFIFLPLKQYKIISRTNCKAIIAAGCSILNSKIENIILKNLSGTKWADTIYKEYDFIEFNDTHFCIT